MSEIEEKIINTVKEQYRLWNVNTMCIRDSASIANDCLPCFLNSYTFDSVYETDDNSLVFDAGGENRIELEFFDFNNPLKRSCSIMYWENGRPVIMNL